MGRPSGKVVKTFTSGSRSNTKDILFVTVKGILMSMTEHMHKHIYGKRIITADQARQYWEELNSMRDICASDTRIWQVYAKLTSQMIILIQEHDEEKQQTEVIAREIAQDNTEAQTLRSNNVALNTKNTYNLRNKAMKKNITSNKQATPDVVESNKNENIRTIQANNCPCMVIKSPKRSRQTRQIISINKTSKVNKINNKNKKRRSNKNLTNTNCSMSKETNIFFHQNQLSPYIQSVAPNFKCPVYLPDEDNLILDLSIPKTACNQNKLICDAPKRNYINECVIIGQNLNLMSELSVNNVPNYHNFNSNFPRTNIDVEYKDESNIAKESSLSNSKDIIKTPILLKIKQKKRNCKTKRAVRKQKPFSKIQITDSQNDCSKLTELCDISKITLKRQNEFTNITNETDLVDNKNIYQNDLSLMSVSSANTINKRKGKSGRVKNIKGTSGKNQTREKSSKCFVDSHLHNETDGKNKDLQNTENVKKVVADDYLSESINIIEFSEKFSQSVINENNSEIIYNSEEQQLQQQTELSNTVQKKTKSKNSDCTISPEDLFTDMSTTGQVLKETEVSISLTEGQFWSAANNTKTGSQCSNTDKDCLNQNIPDSNNNEVSKNIMDDANVIEDILHLRSNQTTPDIIDPTFNEINLNIQNEYLEVNIQETNQINELQNYHNLENNNLYNNIVTQLSEIFLESQDQNIVVENISSAHSNALIIEPVNQSPMESEQVLDISTDTLINNIKGSINTGNIDTAQMSISTEKLCEMQMEENKVGQKTGDFQVSEITPLDLSWLRRIRYVRIVESGEYFNECCLPECFWGNNELPREWISDFENWE